MLRGNCCDKLPINSHSRLSGHKEAWALYNTSGRKYSLVDKRIKGGSFTGKADVFVEAICLSAVSLAEQWQVDVLWSGVLWHDDFCSDDLCF